MLSLLPYLWPAGNPVARLRVAAAMLFLVLAKGATVVVPVIYGRLVDALAPKGGSAGVLVVPMALIAAYGLARIASAGFGELRDALFASVGQRAVRQLALRTFRHLHALSLRFHLDRQTGGLARVIDRGTTGTQSVLRLAVFNVVPTVIELTAGHRHHLAAVRLAFRCRHVAGGAGCMSASPPPSPRGACGCGAR